LLYLTGAHKPVIGDLTLVSSEKYENEIQLLAWNGLRTLWENIKNRNVPGWEAGKAFEYLVLRAFQLDGAEVKWPYTVQLFGSQIEQIDGAIYYGGLSCLVESKDFGDKTVDTTTIAKLRNQLLRRPGGTIGLMFCRTDFTNPARHLSYFSLPQAILLWNGEEIQYALEHEIICELLTFKYHACIEHGLTDYDVRERSVL